MKKTIAIIVAALVLVGVVIFILVKPKDSKSDDKKKKPTLNREQLVGTWEYADGNDFEELVIQENGRYRKTISALGTNLNISDKYTISDDCLILYYDEMGIRYTYNVVFEGEDTMKLYNAGNGELVITYTRKAN